MTSLTPPLLLLLLLAGPAAPQAGPAVEDLIDRNADFGARLYRAVAGRTDGDVFLSPLAASAAMLALLSGSGDGGATRQQLLQALSLGGLDAAALPDVFQALRGAVLQATPPLSLQTGAAVFPDRGFRLPASYLELVQTKLGGVAQSVSYADPAAAWDAINRWALELSQDRIQDVLGPLDPLDPQTRLLLVSAAAYQMRFSPAFNASLTQVERFFVDRYHVVMAPMMLRAGKFFLAYDGGVKAGVLKLPMVDGAAMLAVLPDEGVDVTAVEEEVTSEKIRSWIRRLKKTKLEVQLPVFQPKGSYSLKTALLALDIRQVFQDDADLTNMGGATGAKLSEVYHVATASIEDGGDGDGSGGGATVFSSPPPRLTFNRPFIFIVYQESSGCLLFLGRVVDPTLK